MTLLESLRDGTTWQTERGLLPIFMVLIITYCIMWAMFLFLSRPRNSHYAYKPQIKPRNRVSNWIRSLRPFKSKTRSYRLKNAQRRNTSADELAISNVGRDIVDTHINRDTTNYRTTAHPNGPTDTVDYTAY